MTEITNPLVLQDLQQAPPPASPPATGGQITNPLILNEIGAAPPANSAPAPVTRPSDAFTTPEGVPISGTGPPTAPPPFTQSVTQGPTITNPLVLDDVAPHDQEKGLEASAGRIAGAIYEPLRQMWTAPVGVSQKTWDEFTTTSDPYGLGGTVAQMNRMILASVPPAWDIAGRAFMTPVIAAIAGASQTYQELGGTPTMAKKLAVDLMGMVEQGLIALGMAPEAAFAVPAFNQRLGDFMRRNPKALTSAIEELPPGTQDAAKREIVARMIDAGKQAEETVGSPKGAKTVQQLEMQLEPPITAAPALTPPPSGTAVLPLTEPRTAQVLGKNVVDAAGELLAQGGVRRDQSMLISDQVASLLSTNRLTTPEIQAVLDKHGVTVDQLAGMWRVDIRKAAQDLQMLSAVETRMKALMNQPGAEAELANIQQAAGMDSNALAMAYWRRIDNVRRGLMVTQLATAARNFETQVGRVGIDVLQKGIDSQLAHLFPGPENVKPIDAMQSLLRLVQYSRTKGDVDAIMSAMPKESDLLFSRYASDLSRTAGGSGVLGKVESGVRVLNTINSFQEYAVRRAAFAASLDMRLRQLGHAGVEDFIANNRIGAIPKEAIEGAIRDALDMTFARNWDKDTAAGAFINAINKVPGATIPIPYPRFLMNSMKFMVDYNPVSFLKLLSQAERDKLAMGDTSTISKAMIGSGMLLGAYQLRSSQYAGERWYEVRLPDGRTVDTRPFNPFAGYLFMADLLVRAQNGTLNKLTAPDIVNGLLSSSFRAGAGLYMLDQIIGGVQDLMNGPGTDADKMVQLIDGLTGNVASSFFVPFQQVKDVISQFDESQRVIRSGDEGPFAGVNVGTQTPLGINLGPAIRMLPYAGDRLPAVASPTRSGPIVREEPLLRQATGISVRTEKNPVEREADRLGMRRSDILPSTGNAMADRLVAEKMGPLTERYIVPFVQGQRYQESGNATREMMLKQMFQMTRQIAFAQAASENKDVFRPIIVKRSLSDLERRVIQEKTGRDLMQGR